MFRANAAEVRAAIAMIRDASEVLSILLEGGHRTIAGRLAGAFRNIGREKIADEIIKAMKAAGYTVNETDPFEQPSTLLLSSQQASPYVTRHIRQSMHVPPSKDAIRDLMPAFFDLVRGEDDAAVRVVLGHFMFVYIHPYFDRNGRIGRFLMNTMLASGGYPWTVMTVDRGNEYMAALEEASVKNNIKPFAAFLAELQS